MLDIFANGATSLVQMMNISSVLFLILMLFNPDYPIRNWHGGLLTLGLQVFNHRKYRNHHSFYFLEKKWKGEARNTKIKNGFLVVGYIVFF